MSHKTATKPTGPYDHKVPTADGREMVVHGGACTGAWLTLRKSDADNSRDVSLAVVSAGGQNFVQYRDGSFSNLPRLAVGVDAEGEATIQVVLPGAGSEATRVKTITLAELDRLLGGDSVPQ